MSNKPIVAIMYDFDRTLSPKDMQEYAFIPETGMTSDEFWSKCNDFSIDNDMDSILGYMYVMVQESKKKSMSITRAKFLEQGKSVKLFDGVAEWFSRINAYGESIGLQVEHYVLSSGLKEIIEGTTIADRFTKIYAASFIYNDADEPVWPAMAVNYTSKTQFVYRINKGVLSVTEHAALNKRMPEDLKRVPFRNMVYVGDGLTDVPCMKLVKGSGGHSIAVYSDHHEGAEDLVREGRADYAIPADYTVGSRMDVVMKAILNQIKAVDTTTVLHIEDLQKATK